MKTSARISIVYAHPAHRLSQVNRRLIEAAQSIPTVQLHDLYEAYPDFDIDVSHEQSLLERADLIVLQYPVHWYSTPSLLKEWLDTVLAQGWAYGPGGAALQGKDLWIVATTGGIGTSHQEGGYDAHTFSAFLRPLEHIATLCGMRWLTPLIFHSERRHDESQINSHIDAYTQKLLTYPKWVLHSEHL